MLETEQPRHPLISIVLYVDNCKGMVPLLFGYQNIFFFVLQFEMTRLIVLDAFMPLKWLTYSISGNGPTVDFRINPPPPCSQLERVNLELCEKVW